MEWLVNEENEGVSLQNFIKTRAPGSLSVKRVKKLIESGRCTLNGKIDRFGSMRLTIGDKVELDLSQDELPSVISTFSEEISIEDRILFFNEDLIVFDKPPGVNSDSPKIAERLKIAFGKVILVHRLDKNTSGALMFARSVKSANQLEAAFRKREVDKTYLAIVDGVMEMKSGRMNDEMAKLTTFDGQSLWGVVEPGKGLPAQTDWEVVKSGRNATLIRCWPKTGRTHQIRVHMSQFGHPILGDFQYGRQFTCNVRPNRLMLHAAEIAFFDPNKRKKIIACSPLPPDFEQILKMLMDF